MTVEIAGLLADARRSSAEARAGFAARLRADLPAGCVLLETCHRVELYGPRAFVEVRSPEADAELVGQTRLARHVVSLAVGRESAVLGEDQVLHQLRDAVASARARGPLPATLDRLLDRALRAGRLARTWLPGRRHSLADAALDAAARTGGARTGAVLIVGAGRMGSLAARAALERGHPVVVTSRSAGRAAELARRLGVRTAPFVPAPREVQDLAGTVVALAGEWPIGGAAAEALVGSGGWVVDLSSPSAVPADLARRLAGRFTSVDDLASDGHFGAPAPELTARLDRLVAETVAEHERWLAADAQRAAARALTERAEAAREAELAALWRSLPALDAAERAAVERMATRLAARLLRDPIERLNADGDGRHEAAARELFGL